ncbi:MAG: ABC transporter ATP-binding protein [Fulvivirga sp.]|uniref:ABC transporter ATP-binding protein n=2 Tax=Fulvivirga sp. TaxID=1931237 RepID=UPI0032EB2536
MSLVKVDNVEKQYNRDRKALYPISLSINKNEKLGIVGETGSGKSTLLKVIAGLIAPDGGSVAFKGKVLHNPLDQLIPGHPSIAYLSQHFELPFFRTVEEIVYDPYKISQDGVNELFKACHIDHLIQADSQQLSGGEKQRVAIARLLVDTPEILLLDEPFSNLDLYHQNVIKSTLKNIESTMDTTIVLVAHNPLDVLSWADIILAMKLGKVVQTDGPFNIYNFPNNEYVAGLFGKYNMVNPAKWGIKDKRLTKIKSKVIVRPEAFSISNNKEVGTSGMVLEKTYFGSHEQLLVKVGDEELIVNADVGKFSNRDKVFIHLKPVSQQ